MEEKCIGKLIGKYCKIVTKEPGEDKSHVVTGLVKSIEHEDGFLTIESHQDLGVLNISTIIAIKPKKQNLFSNI